MDRKKIEFVAEFRDEFEFMLDKRRHFDRHTMRPPPAHTRLGKRTKMARRRFPNGDEFMRIFIAQFGQRKINTLGNSQRFL